MTSRIALFFACFASIGCTTPAEVGVECIDSTDCATGLSCFPRSGAAVTPVCMMDCDLDDVRLCADGSVCLQGTAPGRPADLGFCYLGGTVSVGSTCASNYDCELGATCVDENGDGTFECYDACSTDDPEACGDGEECSPLEDEGTRGFCEPAPEA